MKKIRKIIIAFSIAILSLVISIAILFPVISIDDLRDLSEDISNFDFSEYMPDRDSNRRLPSDTVKNFIKFVQAEDYVSAKKLWYGTSKWSNVRLSDGTIESFTTPFEKFCARYRNIDLKKFQISTGRGKSGFTMIYIDWDENGEKKHDFFGLKIIQGQWKMERGYYW